MERKLWRVALILSIGLLILACCHAHAHADERVLPPGTTVQLPRGGERVVLDSTQFLVDRSSVDRANATAEMNRRLKRNLMQCSESLQERERPEASWKVAARWTGIGLAVGAAFALGVLASN